MATVEINTDNILLVENDMIEFDVEMAIAYFLMNGIMFFNTFSMLGAAPDNLKYKPFLLVGCNELFDYNGDAEPIEYYEIRTLFEMYRVDPIYGVAVWVCIKRQKLPREKILRQIEREGIWDLVYLIMS